MLLSVAGQHDTPAHQQPVPWAVERLWQSADEAVRWNGPSDLVLAATDARLAAATFSQRCSTVIQLHRCCANLDPVTLPNIGDGWTLGRRDRDPRHLCTWIPMQLFLVRIYYIWYDVSVKLKLMVTVCFFFQKWWRLTKIYVEEHYVDNHVTCYRLGTWHSEELLGHFCAIRLSWKAQTPLHGHRLRTCCTTPPTDTTNGRAHNNSTTNLPNRNARAQHLDMSRCSDVANFCPLVMTLLYKL